jgi:hypothetical protein
MSRKFLSVFIAFIISLFIITKPALAAENPIAVANNKIGIHILNNTEIPLASKLVNANGGDWGYVLIPVQSGDKDLIKWQQFMNDCKKYHLIPIVRLATEGDPFRTTVWRTPAPADIIDFANFLDSLDWPTKNRYVIVYNEVNRGDEWGGNADPKAYAELLSFASSVFKSKSTDFFMISAGLDNAAPDQGNVYINEYNYIKQMNQAVPGIFNQVDGMSSHSYPNPGFSQPPDNTSSTGVGSFGFERALIKTMRQKDIPVFITETGWSSETVTEDKRVQYYNQTLASIWNDPGIVAITPFLLQAGAGPFEKFTFITANGYQTKQYKFIQSLPKTKGVPSFPTRKVLGANTSKFVIPEQAKDFTNYKQAKRSFSLVSVMENVFDYLIQK